MKEYSTNADFWKHHDTMRQKKMQNFLTVNSILAAAITLLTSSIFSNTQIISIFSIICLSIIGFFISLTWNSVMSRNSDYMDFQRLQLCSIEKELPEGFRTFTKMHKAFDLYEEINFSCSREPFKTKNKSANKLESAFPKLLAVSWFVVSVSCVGFLIHIFLLS